MAEVASAYVSLLPSAKGFGKSTQRQITPQMNSVAKTTGTRFGKVFAYASMSPLKAIGAAAFGLFAIQKVKQFFQGAIAEAREAQKVSAITAQVIKSTGGAANISAEQVGKLSESISNMTGIDDEAIQTGANLLLTFKNLRNEAGEGNKVFDQATRTITDMSVALGTEVKGAAIQVGKALNDPIKGISALTRVGVTFTEQQKKQIETLVESGNTLKAQKIILKELNSEFGGTAAAAATAGDRFKVAFANFQEAVGTSLLPYLDRLLIKGVKVIGFLENDVPRGFAAFKNAVSPVVDVIRGFVEDHLPAFKVGLAALGGSALTSVISLLGGGLLTVLGTLAAALVSPVALIGALAGAALYAYLNFEGFRTRVNDLAAAFQTNVLPKLQAFGGYLVDTVIPAVTAFSQRFAGDVLPTLQQFGAYLTSTFIPRVTELAQTVGGNLKPVWEQLVATFQGSVLPALQRLAQALRNNGPEIRAIVEAIGQWIAKGLELWSIFASKVSPVLLRFAGFVIDRLIPAVAAGIGIFIKIVAALVAFGTAVANAASTVVAFARKVVEKVGDVIGAIKELPGKVSSILNDLASTMYDAGIKLVSMLAEGIRDKAKDAIGALKDVAGKLAGLVPGSPVKYGPLTAFNGGAAGRKLMEMMADGIEGAGPKLLKAMSDVLDRTLDKVTSFRDGLRSALDSVRSDFTSLRDSVASTFTGDLFGAVAIEASVTDGIATLGHTVGEVWTNTLKKTRGNLTQLLGAFQTLKGWGVPAEFLSQLFASGNSGLILEMASGSRGEAQSAASLFSDVQSLSAQLGTDVAGNQFGDEMRGMRQELRQANRHLRYLDTLARDLGKALDNASASTQRETA